MTCSVLTCSEKAFDERLGDLTATNKTNEHLERQRVRRLTSVNCKQLVNASELESKKASGPRPQYIRRR